MKDTKISILMSVCNGEKYLKKAIDSILEQSFRDFEFIIVDDGSCDNTLEILKDYAEKDSRIEIIKNEKNIGLTKSLNKAIQEAKGEYIARMDADDIALPERLKEQIEFLEKNPEIGLLGTGYYEIVDNKIISKKYFPPTDEKLRKILIKYNPFFHASVMLRKSVIQKVGLYDECFKRAQDYELWFRIAAESKMANLSELLMMRRYDFENISIRNENEQLEWAIKIRKNVILKGQYSIWNVIYLIRPYIVLKMPIKVRRVLRKYLLKSKIYG